tara:strand:+ start:702 stop:830 length:129 start_codon:yes stop_codon:yes gene_type:complete
VVVAVVKMHILALQEEAQEVVELEVIELLVMALLLYKDQHKN